jgi:hypothetical protein
VLDMDPLWAGLLQISRSHISMFNTIFFIVGDQNTLDLHVKGFNFCI